MGDVEVISREEWRLVLENRLGTTKFDLLSFKLNRLSTTGGFLGEHYAAETIVKLYQSENTERVFRFFLKVEPKPKPGERNIATELNVFKKEVDTLNMLFVKMRSALHDGGKKMKWACECYYTRSDAIVLEDLSEKGFWNFTLRDTMHFEHFALTLRALANLHSASIIYEEKQPMQPYRLIDDYPDLFEEVQFRHGGPDHSGTQWLEVSVRTMLYLVECIFGETELSRSKAELEKFMNTMYDLQEPSKRFRNMVGQGDMKRDNILFRHEREKPAEVCIVDYQFTRYAPPANDVMCFLYLSGNREFRRQYATQLLSVYYDQFSKNLAEHGLNSNEILSWKEFQDSCVFYKKLGVIIATCYAPITFIPGEIIRDVLNSPQEIDRFLYVDRTPEVTKAYKSDNYYKEKIREIIEEFIEECRV